MEASAAGRVSFAEGFYGLPPPSSCVPPPDSVFDVLGERRVGPGARVCGFPRCRVRWGGVLYVGPPSVPPFPLSCLEGQDLNIF